MWQREALSIQLNLHFRPQLHRLNLWNGDALRSGPFYQLICHFVFCWADHIHAPHRKRPGCRQDMQWRRRGLNQLSVNLTFVTFPGVIDTICLLRKPIISCSKNFSSMSGADSFQNWGPKRALYENRQTLPSLVLELDLFHYQYGKVINQLEEAG